MENRLNRQHGERYRIKLAGVMDDSWSDWLNGLLEKKIHSQFGDVVWTEFIVMVPDQVALRGLVNRIWDLNLTLYAVERISTTDVSEERASVRSEGG